MQRDPSELPRAAPARAHARSLALLQELGPVRFFSSLVPPSPAHSPPRCRIIAGAINLGTNINRSTGGKGALASPSRASPSLLTPARPPAVNYKTLISFIALQVFAVPVAFLVRGPNKVRRGDGSRITLPNQTSTKEQFRLLWKTVTTKKVGLLLPIFFVRPALSLTVTRTASDLLHPQASWLCVPPPPFTSSSAR